jgi:hypothetical protein
MNSARVRDYSLFGILNARWDVDLVKKPTRRSLNCGSLSVLPTMDGNVLGCTMDMLHLESTCRPWGFSSGLVKLLVPRARQRVSVAFCVNAQDLENTINAVMNDHD